MSIGAYGATIRSAGEGALRASAHTEQMQGVRGGGICEHQREESTCKECGGEVNLCASLPEENMQGVRVDWYL